MVHGSVQSFFRFITSLAMLLLVGLAVFALRLANGPISVDFIAPYVADSISIEGEIQFGIRRAILSWDGIEESPEVRILDVTAVDQSGQAIAVFPEMTVRLSLLSVLEGSPAPQEIILTNPIVRLTRRVDGTLLFGLDPDKESALGLQETVENRSGLEESANALLHLVVRALSDPGDSSNLPGYLDGVSIRNAAIVFSDQRSGLEWLVPSGRIELFRDQEGVRLESKLPYFNSGESSEILLNGIYAQGEETLSLSLAFKNLRPSSFALLLPSIPYMEGMDIDVSGLLHVDLSLSNASLTLKTAQLEIEQGQGVVSLPEPIMRKIPLEKIKLVMNAQDSLSEISIGSFSAKLLNKSKTGPIMRLSLNGSRLLVAPNVSMQISIDSLTLNELTTYWPEKVKPNTRTWIKRSLRKGDITNVTFDVVLGGQSVQDLDVVSFSGEAHLNGFEVTYIKNMPPIENVSGVMSLGLSEVVIDVAVGQVTKLETEGQLDIQSGRVRLYGLDTKSHMADIDIRVDGKLRDVISLIDEDPLNYASALGISPLSTSGGAQVLLGLDFPLIQNLNLDQIMIEAQATIEQAKIDDMAFGLSLEAGQFSLLLDNSGMDVTGTASLGGIRTGLAWRENFSVEQIKRQYALDAVVENDQRRLIKLDQVFFSPPYIDGPVRIEALYTIHVSGEADFAIEADLGKAHLSIPQLNWEKQADVSALFTAELNVLDNRLASIDHFSVRSQGANLDVVGHARFSKDVSLEVLNLDKSVIGKSIFSVQASSDSNAVTTVSAEGSVLDASNFWTTIRQSDQTRSIREESNIQKLPEYRFTGRVDRLLLSPDGELTNVQASVEQKSTGLSSIELSALVNDEDAFTLTMESQDKGRLFEAESENGGAVLRALGLGDDFVDGDLSVTGAVQESGAVEGTFNMGSFKVVDAPLLARLLSVASLTGIVDELEGSGISFSELNLPFSYADNVFSVQNGAMHGASLGLTGRGRYDANQNTVEGEGTLIPAYAFNSAVGSIPILGPILIGGEKSGGVFSATYTVRGNPEGAEITVNPLATLTPGFLRQIFKVFDPPPLKPNEPEEKNVVESGTE